MMRSTKRRGKTNEKGNRTFGNSGVGNSIIFTPLNFDICLPFDGKTLRPERSGNRSARLNLGHTKKKAPAYF